MSVLDPILSDIKLLEEHLLCAMVLDPGCIDMMRADRVSGSAWATPYLGAFFDLLCDLTDRRLPTDSVELTIYLHRSHADAARIGDPFWGKPYSTPSSEAHWAANGLSYANHVMSHCTPLGFSRLYGEWKRKRLEARIRTLGARIQSLPETRGDLDTDGLLEEAEALSASIAGEVAPTATTTGAAAAQSARDRYAERKALRSRGERVGVVTGLSVLDDGDGGALPGLFCLKPGTVTLVAARPGVGKTSLMLQIALNNLLAGKGVGIFSLEMTADQLTDKLACMMAGVNTRAAEEARLSRQDEERFLAALDAIEELPLLIDDTSAITPEALTSKARRMKAQLRQQGGSLDLLCLDYVQLMGGRADREIDRVTAASKAYTAICKTLSVPGLLVAQMNREVEKRKDKTPLMSDLADSSQLEKDAYNILFLHREFEACVEQEASIIVAKARGGGLGTYHVGFTTYNQAFWDLGGGQ